MKKLLGTLGAIPFFAAAALISYAFFMDEQQRAAVSISPNKVFDNAFNSMPESEHGWQVKEGSVYDGDTLRVVRGGEELKIRFCGIDAPEKEQALGTEARDYLRSLLDKGNGEVILVPIETDRYGRTVAELFVPIGGDQELFLNGEMIAAGMAWHYAQYSDNCPNKDVLVAQEEVALEQKLGVHKSESVKPWEWRKENK